MHFESWSAFWSMGGYALFVWTAFGVSGLALAIILMDSILAKRKLFVQVHKDVARRQRISAANKSKTLAGNTQIPATNLDSGESVSEP
jgi:heme exporter protein D